MKNLVILFLIAVASQLCAQNNPTANDNRHGQKGLYYFATKDSTLIGVEDENGKIIIPAQFDKFCRYDFKIPIKDSLIEFCWDSKFRKDTDQRDGSPAFSGGEVWDRNGKYLYTVLWFDMGMDYYKEGVRRIIKNGKVGFADKAGSIIVPPQYDWADPYRYGYAQVTMGKMKQHREDDEHWTVRCEGDCQTFYIDKTGKRVTPQKQKSAEYPLDLDGGFFPNPFVYNNFEKKIVDSLNAMDIINDINLMGLDNEDSRENYLLHFQITERPRKDEPFYILEGYDKNYSAEDDMTFAVSADGKKIYKEDYTGVRVPLKEWIIEELHSAKEYFQRLPHKPHRFDVDARLKVWEAK